MTARKTKKTTLRPEQQPPTPWGLAWAAVILVLIGVATWYTTPPVSAPEQTTEAVLTERYNAQRAAQQQAVDVVAMVCRELKGDDRAFKDDDRLQVQCDADIPGVFFWDFRNEAGEWETVYYNERPTFSTGYLFANAPEEIRVQFRAINGNTAEYYLTLPKTDERPAA